MTYETTALPLSYFAITGTVLLRHVLGYSKFYLA
jgi:hypothetical protein